jgi:hypothetical protein
MSRTITLTLILILAVSSLMFIRTASSSIPTPQVPEFTVQLVSHPYDVPPSSSSTVDKYTGKEIVTTQPGYHVENKSIEITIKNQRVATDSNTENYTINIYYNVRVKGHFAEDWEWKELFSPYEIPTREGFHWCGNPSPIQSSSEKTAIACSPEYPQGAKVDFQVQALQGYFTKYYPIISSAYGWYFTGTISDWSNTQTITIGSGEVSVSQSPVTPSPTPFQPEPTTAAPTAELTQTPPETSIQPNTQTNVLSGFAWEHVALVVACVIIAALVVVLVLSQRRRV